MSNVLLVVDNSNIYVENKQTFGKDARFSYNKFEKTFYSNDTFVKKQMTGSTPPSTDSFWNKMRQEGYDVRTYERKQNIFGRTKEKVVDTSIVADAIEIIITEKPDVVVLLSGDLDMRPIVEKAKKYNCIVHMWSFRNSASINLEKECDDVFYIDDHYNELIYFQSLDGSIETLIERNERLERERVEREERIERERLEREEINKRERLEREERIRRLRREREEKQKLENIKRIALWKNIGKGAITVLGLGVGMLAIFKFRK